MSVVSVHLTSGLVQVESGANDLPRKATRNKKPMIYRYICVLKMWVVVNQVSGGDTCQLALKSVTC